MRSKGWMMYAFVLAGVVGMPVAHADVTGSYKGSVSSKKQPGPVAASAVFSQSLKNVTGTIALPGDLATVGGAYIVLGKAPGKKIKVSGTGAPGVKLKFTGKIVGNVVSGNLSVKGPGTKLAGKLTLTRQVPTSDGSSCDAVYTANQSFFDTQVLGQALVACKSCHEPGLQAAQALFRVDPTNGLATARSVALQIDSTTPTASRILTKPLNQVPHGGMVQLTAGSPEEQILTQWVNLVAQAHCQ